MKLTRSSNGMIAGVASGVARAAGLDPTLVRLAFVLFAVGGGLLIYIVLWVILPRENDGGTVAEEGIAKAREWYDDRNR